ncbi:C39 family peptidase [Luteipulveratus mongoliensis]|uniref:Membrane protein n=1 Tax=Luteipulveratus mongoliensis TaxID=571913 RepID=A0A0K1JKF4_9MICO|nr:C39 family peptidase [Luteipulveratus mongoliensis]AKU17073.1 membrane protein [Luteipulveratus mongoliensis]
MSDRCHKTAGSARLELSRRALIGGGAALGGALVIGSTQRAAATTATSQERHIRLHRYVGAAAFAHGQRQGVRANAHGLTLHHPTQTRTYADPHAAGASASYDVGTWTSPVIHNAFRLTELISSWNADTPGKTWIEVEVRGVAETGVRTGWFVLGRWCRNDPDQGGAIFRTSVDDQGTDIATVWTDTLSTQDDHTLNDLELRISLMRPQGSAETPTVHQLTAMCSSLPSDATVTTSTPGPKVGRVLDVPPYSQELHIGQYPQWDNGGEAWCSPTSTAMVLDHWKKGPSAAELSWVEPMQDPQVAYSARNTFDYTYDGCGNWPFNTAYAARNGLRGFVTRLRSLREAEDFIAAGIPLITSLSFKAADMDGAGYSTSGHLMVLRGFDAQGNPVMNDPASHLIADNAQVQVTYKRGQFENAWVPHSGGTVYVIHPEGARLPRAGAEANW